MDLARPSCAPSLDEGQAFHYSVNLNHEARGTNVTIPELSFRRYHPVPESRRVTGWKHQATTLQVASLDS